jgi:isoquinoline 1-oxidoreductase beta subunit
VRARAPLATPVSRRRFIRTSAALGGGLVVGFYVPGAGKRLFAQAGAPKPLPNPNSFLRIGSDESVTVLLAHSEMGQGIWTTLPMLINEELGADWSRIRVEHAPAAPAYAHALFGMQMTGGSSTTYSEMDRYRQAGAAARMLLVAAAAKRWGVSEDSCRVENGWVVNGANRLSFGALAEEASALPPPTSVTLKDPSTWTLIGKDTRRLDTPEKISGKAVFGLDVKLPDLATAVVARPPVFGGTLKGFDDGKAKAVPGVRAVFAIPSGVAVVADDFWSAKKGRDALTVDWENGPNAALESAKMREEYLALSKTSGKTAKAGGDVGAALARAAKTVTATYTVPFLAHAPMEPLNCTVRKTPGGCEIWTGTQFQTMDQSVASKILGIEPKNVLIHTTFLGGGFGRRANPTSDFVSEAVHVAKSFDRPVKLVWTRDDDIRGGYYRPMAVHRIEGALDANGRPEAWRHRVVSSSILEGTPFAAVMVKNGIDETSVEGASDSPYLLAIPHHLVELHTAKKSVPVLWWRSVGHSHTAFAVESFLDELAHAAGKDPLDFRLALLSKAPRLRAALALAAEKAGWGKPLPKGHGLGLAVHESFESIVAEVAEVAVENGRIRVLRVVCAVDCGMAVNPLAVRAQMEGAIAFGLGAALKSRLSLKKGRVVESNFHDYEVLRMSEMPQVEVHILNSHEKTGGVGEPGTPPIAPAVANALFAATGKRLRDLPLRLA